MATTDPRTDAYIAQAAEFARPMLHELRARVHAACPDVVEMPKWGAPGFTYKGKILAVMAAFKQHVAFNLWHGSQVVGGERGAGEAMGQFGRLTKLSDLPGKRAMAGYLQQAMALIDAGVTPSAARTPRPKVAAATPDDLATALAANPPAKTCFDAFTPGKQREYVEWLTQAKREDTRQRRLEQAVEWIAEGKTRNWKYEKC